MKWVIEMDEEDVYDSNNCRYIQWTQRKDEIPIIPLTEGKLE